MRLCCSHQKGKSSINQVYGMAKELKTGWICLATSGAVVYGKADGRQIKKEWLQDMADTFDLSVFTPCLWPDHYRYYNFGKIVAVKVEPVTSGPLKGELQLFGILCPNDALIVANKEGQYCYPSIEVGENFHGTGKYFLQGVGVTDEPASAGVSELKFKSRMKDPSAQIFPGEKFNVAESIEQSTAEQEPAWFKSFLSKHLPQFKSTHIDEDETTMITPEQMTELKQAIDDTIDAKFTKLQEELKKAAEPAPAEPAPSTPAAVSVTESPEYKALKTQLDDLTERFKAATEERAPGTPVPAPTGDQKKLVL